jgi:DNA polymerase-3 subunit epsilon
MRQVVLDTETTGINIKEGNRIIEIGCIEVIDRKLTGRHYHQYVNAGRDSEEGALRVHGITTEFLADKPVFSTVVDEFLEFVKGAELVIHNAPFDIGFLNHELNLMGGRPRKMEDYCTVLDTLVMARRMRPGQKNNLNALCRHYGINNDHRELHGALLDSEILADVYLLMTGGQVGLSLSSGQEKNYASEEPDIYRLATNRPSLKVLLATPDELFEHQRKLKEIQKKSDDNCIWLNN